VDLVGEALALARHPRIKAALVRQNGEPDFGRTNPTGDLAERTQWEVFAERTQ
jgi:hypothetical protein